MSIKRFVEGAENRAQDFKKNADAKEEEKQEGEMSENEKMMREAKSLYDLSKIIMKNNIQLEKKLPDGGIKIYETIDLVNAIAGIKNGFQGFDIATRTDNFRDIVRDLYISDAKKINQREEERDNEVDEKDIERNVDEILFDEKGNQGPVMKVIQRGKPKKKYQ